MRSFTRTYGRSTLTLGERTLVMGIVNVTPDSFYDGGQFDTVASAVEHAKQLVHDGADIIDIGGESTRPHSSPVGAEEELARVIPVVRAIRQEVGVPISIDTYKAEIAAAAVDAGADIVNDIGGLLFDEKMPSVVASSGAGCVVMHNARTRDTMHEPVRRDDPVRDVVTELGRRIEFAVDAGIAREKLIVDPGIGFAKSPPDDLALHARLGELGALGLPILFASSRKRFIGAVLGLEKDDRLEGTIASCVVAALHGASLVRVHDVKEVSRALKIVDAIRATQERTRRP